MTADSRNVAKEPRYESLSSDTVKREAESIDAPVSVGLLHRSDEAG